VIACHRAEDGSLETVSAILVVAVVKLAVVELALLV